MDRIWRSRCIPLAALCGLTIFLAALALRFPHLQTARFLEPDEYRSLSALNIKVPLFNAVYKLPILMFGASQGTALLTSALLGSLIPVLIFFIARPALGTQNAFFLAILAAVVPSAVRYSRLALPIALQSILLLLLYATLLKFLSTQRALYLRLASLLIACLVLTYLPSYSAVVSLGVGFFLLQRDKLAGIKNTAVIALWTAMIFALGVAIFSYSAAGRIDLGGYVGKVLLFQERTKEFISDVGIWNILTLPFSQAYYEGGLAQAIFLGGGILLSVHAVIQRRSKSDAELLAASLIVGSLGFFCFNAVLGSHTLYWRHLVHLLPFLILIYGYSLRSSAFWSGAKVAVLALFLAQSVSISQYFFSVQVIRTFLTENGIQLNSVITGLDLSLPGDADSAIPVVGEYADTAGTIKINWHAVEHAQATRGAKYLLTSGIGTVARVGHGEERLSAAVPVQTWRHPYRDFYPPDSLLEDFKLYKLDPLPPKTEEGGPQ